jgi:glutamate racemase
MPSTAPIGLFDSGIGGLSVLKTVREALPHENLVYYGDSANAPYGVRAPEEILSLTRAAVAHLVERGIKALVIACNTATGVAHEALSRELRLQVLGIQPALEAAQKLRRSGDILALATPATFKTERYAALYRQHGDHVVSLPAPGLMEFVERRELSGDRLNTFLTDLFAPYQDHRFDVVVLGCTHYPFLKEAIAPFFRGAALIDDSPRVARELAERLGELQLLNDSGQPGSLTLLSSGGDEAVDLMRTFL